MALADESLVPDLDAAAYLRYQSLVKQRHRIDKQIEKLITGVRLVARPQWGPCTRCGATWRGMQPRIRPKHCAKCGTPYWMKPYAKARPARLHVEQPVPATPKASVVRPFGPYALLAGVGSLTPPPPPVELNYVPRHVAAPQPESYAKEPVHEENNVTIDFDEGEPAPSSESPSPASEGDDGPKCCSTPLIVEGFCLSCGQGLEKVDNRGGDANGHHEG